MKYTYVAMTSELPMGVLTIRETLVDLTRNITVDEGGILNLIIPYSNGIWMSRESNGMDCNGLMGYGYWDEVGPHSES